MKFMVPTDKTCSARSSFFAVGCICWQCCCSCSGSVDSSFCATTRDAASGPQNMERRKCQNIPDPVLGLCLSCLFSVVLPSWAGRLEDYPNTSPAEPCFLRCSYSPPWVRVTSFNTAIPIIKVCFDQAVTSQQTQHCKAPWHRAHAFVIPFLCTSVSQLQGHSYS